MSINASQRVPLEGALSLLDRTNNLKPFAAYMTMVPAAAISARAHQVIAHFLERERSILRRRVMGFISWVKNGNGQYQSPAGIQRRYAIKKLCFVNLLTIYDMFADIYTQRSEHEFGIWIAGLDAIATDALSLAPYLTSPPVVCYLDRGLGAAIRRARTRLPGGRRNPVAMVRIPRERMVGTGIASSLVHEVGHQAERLLGLSPVIKPLLRNKARARPARERRAWRLWSRWTIEVLADIWAVSRLGLTASRGLMEVLSVPRPFVFRIRSNDPHPAPWIRVKAGLYIGNVLYPDPQWDQLSEKWEQLYPLRGLRRSQRLLLRNLEQVFPAVLKTIFDFRPQSLQGEAIGDIVRLKYRRPPQLRALYKQWTHSKRDMLRTRPTLVMAVLGQARIDGRMDAKQESRIVTKMLSHWALQRSVDKTATAKRSVQSIEPGTLFGLTRQSA